MNHCHHIIAMLDDYLDMHLDDVETSLIHRHLARCPDCEAAFRHAQSVHRALREWPPEEECEAAAQRALAGAMAKLATTPVASSRWSQWRPVLLAASLAGMFIFGGYLMPWGNQSADHAPAVILLTSQVQPVQLSLETGSPVERVTLTLELPEHVHLAGYPLQQTLSWETRLDTGINRLTLPLHATAAGEGDLRLTIRSPSGFQNTQVIRLHSKDTGSPLTRAFGQQHSHTI